MSVQLLFLATIAEKNNIHLAAMNPLQMEKETSYTPHVVEMTGRL